VTASVPGESNQNVEPQRRNRYPRAGRRLRRTDFERVYKLGRRHFSASITVFYLERRPGSDARALAPGLRVGFTVSRALGGAVQRNRMKRRLREAVRLTRPYPGGGVDVVINPKKVVLTVDFSALLNEVGKAFVVIEKKLASTEAGTGVLNKQVRESEV
jgi:ribonuclease P protein component